jgi:hypothetical protein
LRRAAGFSDMDRKQRVLLIWLAIAMATLAATSAALAATLGEVPGSRLSRSEVPGLQSQRPELPPRADSRPVPPRRDEIISERSDVIPELPPQLPRSGPARE